MVKLEKVVQRFVFESVKSALMRINEVTYNDNGTATIKYEKAYYDELNECWQTLDYRSTIYENGEIVHD